MTRADKKRMEQLERENAELREKIQADDREGARVLLWDMDGGKPVHRGLAVKAHVIFLLRGADGRDREMQVQVEDRGKRFGVDLGEALHIRSVEGSLIVMPSSSNTVQCASSSHF
jgi:hypothetical protein